MTEESGLALERLIAAFHEHYLIARAGDQADAESLVAAEEALRDAFFTYYDELFTRFGVELPFDLLDDEFDDEEDDLEEEEAEDGDDDFIDVDD